MLASGARDDARRTGVSIVVRLDLCELLHAEFCLTVVTFTQALMYCAKRRISVTGWVTIYTHACTTIGAWREFFQTRVVKFT